MLCIYTHQYNKCSTPCEAPEMAALPPLIETQGYPRRLYHECLKQMESKHTFCSYEENEQRLEEMA